MSNILHEQRGQDGINVNDLLKQVRSSTFANNMDGLSNHHPLELKQQQ